MGGHLNGPVGEYTDPTVYVDKLPQPFRLVDKLLAEIVENALNVAGEAERAREEVLMNKSDTFFAPKMVLDDLGHVTCYAVNQGASHIFVGNAEGQLLVVHVETQSIVVRSDVHPSPITALDVVTRISSEGEPQVLLASSSNALVCVYEVVFADNVLNLKATAAPPRATAAEGKDALSFSPGGTELILAGGKGALSAYKVPDDTPAPLEEAGGGQKKGASPEDLAMKVLLWVPEDAAADVVLPGEGQGDLLPPRFHLRMKKAWAAPGPKADADMDVPDSEAPAGGGDKPLGAWGLYALWPGHNRLCVYRFAAVDIQEAGPDGDKDKEADAAAAGPQLVTSAPVYDWVTSHALTASGMTTDGMHLATGMSNGAVVVWDDHLMQQNEVLPRVEGEITCLEFMDGASVGLLVGTSEGLVYTCDLVNRVILRHDPPGAGAVEDIRSEHGSSLLVILRPEARVQVYDAARRAAVGDVAPPQLMGFALGVVALPRGGGGGVLLDGALLYGARAQEATPEETASSPPSGGEGDADADEKDAEGGKEEGAKEGEAAEDEGPVPPSAAALAVYDPAVWWRASLPVAQGRASPMLERMLTDNGGGELLGAYPPGSAAGVPLLKPVPPAGGGPSPERAPRGAGTDRAPGALALAGQEVYLSLPPSRSRSLGAALESARNTAARTARSAAVAEAQPLSQPPLDQELQDEDPVTRIQRTIAARGGGRRERRRRVEKAHGDLLQRLAAIATIRPSLLPM